MGEGCDGHCFSPLGNRRRGPVCVAAHPSNPTNQPTNQRHTHHKPTVNQQEVCAALNAVCRLTTVDTIPAVLPEVVNKLKHEVRPPVSPCCVCIVCVYCVWVFTDLLCVVSSFVCRLL